MRGPGTVGSELRNVIQAHGLDQRSFKLAKLCRLIERGHVNDHTARIYWRAIEPLVEKQRLVGNYLVRSPTQEELNGDQGPPQITFAQIAEAPDIRVGLQLEHACHHLLVSGMTGAGKTTLARNLLHQALQYVRDSGADLSILAFIIKGELYEPDPMARFWKVVALGHDLKVSFNSPEGVPPAFWFAQVCRATAVRGKMIKGADVQMAALNDIYAHLVDDNGSRPGLSLRMVHEVINRWPTLFAEKTPYADTLLQCLGYFLNNSMGTFDADRGLDVNAELAEPGGVLVVDLTAAPPAVASLVIDLLILQWTVPLLYQHRVSPHTRRIVCIDDADRAAEIQSEAQRFDGYTPLIQGYRQMREFGIAMWNFVAFINSIDRLVRGNTSVHISFNQSDPDALAVAGRTLLLSPKQAPLLGRLKPGEAVVRYAQGGGWPHAMLVHTDYLPPNMAPRPIDTYRPEFQPATHLKDHPELEQYFARRWSQRKQAKTTAIREDNEIGTLARDFLDLIYLLPNTPASRLWPRLERTVSPEAQKAARIELEQAKLATFVDSRWSSTNQLLPDITKKGLKYLGKEAVKTGLEGAPEHRFQQHAVDVRERERGRKTYLRWRVPDTDHYSDVASVRPDGRMDTFECVNTAKTNLSHHVQACLIDSDAVVTVTIIALRKSILDQLRKRLLADPRFAALSDRIFFEPALKYLEEAFS